MKEIRSLLKNIHCLAEDYIGELADMDKPMNKRRSADELKREIGFSLPEAGKGLARLKEMVQTYLGYAVRSGSPRYYNQLFSGFSLPGYVGELLTALTNTSMYTYEISSVATLIERELIKKMNQLIGFEKGEGIFVTGGSNANLISLFAAVYQSFPHVKKQGWRGDEKPVFFVSDQAHYSFSKAAALLGLGLRAMIKVASNKRHQMDPLALKEALAKARQEGKTPFYVGATAGTTVFGAFDPFEEISNICRENHLWFHIDGAWGGSVILSKTHKSLLKGTASANSFTWDAHKMMGMPLICSVILFNQEKILSSLNDIGEVEYLFHGHDDARFDLGRLSLQCGRRVDGLKLWLAWQCYGDEGWAEKIDKMFRLTQFAQKQVEKRENLVLVSPAISLNLCFQYVPAGWDDREKINAFNIALREKLNDRGKAFVNYSAQDAMTFIRLVVVNFDLEENHLSVFFDDVEETARELLV